MARPALSISVLSALAWTGVALLPAAAGAATITVDTELDLDAADGLCSLREAIVAANDDAAHNDCPAGAGADRIVFDLVLPEIIVLTDHLPAISEALAIRGPGATDLVVDGDTLYRPLTLDSPGDDGWLLVEDLSVTHGRTPLGDPYGGGARIAPGETAIFRRVRFIGNRAENGGGGLVAESNSVAQASVTLLDCLFVDNAAEGASGGGGLYTGGTGNVVRIVGSTFWANRAEHANGAGAGMRTTRATVTIEASTISGNVANSAGGGIYVSTDPIAGSTLIVRDSTITDNTASEDLSGGPGGGIRADVHADNPLLLIIENTVVAANFDFSFSPHPDVSCTPSLTGLAGSGSDFIGSNEGCATVFPAGTPNAAGDFVGTAAAPLAPELEFLAYHGGPTPTHEPSLAPLSPLIDQGSCPDALGDQRGYGEPSTGRRPVDLPGVPDAAGGDGCDIGAFEVQAQAVVSPVIFADGFESGHALMWSAEVP
jgi:CSLREA domain-containing protein